MWRMKVKIGTNWYDSDVQPIMVVLSAEEKNLIANMDGEANNFCAFPDGSAPEQIRAFMGEIQNKTFKLHQLKGE